MKYDLNSEIDNGLKNYFNCLSGSAYDPISKEEEHRLLKRYRYDNDLSARDKLIKSNLRFACRIADSYRGRGVSFNDLISEANDGLIESIDRFDLDRDIKLYSYSVWWIKQKVKAIIDKNGRMPQSELPSDNEGQLERETDEDVAYTAPTITSPEFIEIMERNEDETDKTRFLNSVFGALTEREKDMVSMSFGLYGTEYKLDEIGRKYNITKERARQIIEQALTKLRCKAMIVENKYL